MNNEQIEKWIAEHERYIGVAGLTPETRMLVASADVRALLRQLPGGVPEEDCDPCPHNPTGHLPVQGELDGKPASICMFCLRPSPAPESLPAPTEYICHECNFANCYHVYMASRGMVMVPRDLLRTWESVFRVEAGLPLYARDIETLLAASPPSVQDQPASSASPGQGRGKPSWDDAPEWAQWLAQNESGTWLWFRREPYIAFDESWDCNPDPEYNRAWQVAEHGRPNPNWRDTLEQRPSPPPAPDTEDQSHG